MAVSRVAHTLQPMVRRKLGSYTSADQLQNLIQRWFDDNFVCNKNASEDLKSKKPFEWAEISIAEDKKNPGVYNVGVHIKPHFSVEEVNVTTSLVASRDDE